MLRFINRGPHQLEGQIPLVDQTPAPLRGETSSDSIYWARFEVDQYEPGYHVSYINIKDGVVRRRVWNTAIERRTFLIAVEFGTQTRVFITRTPHDHTLIDWRLACKLMWGSTLIAGQEPVLAEFDD